MGGACSTYGEECRFIQVLMGKSEGKRPIGRPRRRWEYNIKTYLQKVEWGIWIGSNWLRIGTVGGHL
jgi:hypothetical protein